jgi:hypothetical protein
MRQRPALGADGGKVTKALQRRVARSLGRKAFTLEPLGEHGDVLVEFVVDLIVDGRLPEEAHPGAKELSHARVTRA